MGPQGKLLIVEGVYPPRIAQTAEGRGAAANDVNMLVRHRRPAALRGRVPLPLRSRWLQTHENGIDRGKGQRD